ncbi:hypothetical protein ACKWTF_015486 [Chironomus riparius]
MKLNIKSISNLTRSKFHRNPKKALNSKPKIQYCRGFKNQNSIDKFKNAKKIAQKIPETSQKSRATTTETIAELKYQESLLRQAIIKASRRNKEELQTYTGIIIYLINEQIILKERLKMLTSTCSSYKNLILRMQKIINSLRMRLHAHYYINYQEEVSEDEGFCEKFDETEQAVEDAIR